MYYAEPVVLETLPRADLRPLSSAHWDPGAEFAHEHGQGFVSALRVISDDERGLAGWLAPGSAVLQGRLADGRGLRASGTEDHTSPRIVARTRWRGPGIIKLFLPARPYSVWFFWTDAGEFDGWYVNLETPARRGERCIANVDQILDVWVQSSGEAHLKDAADLDTAVACGRCSREVAEQVRANATLALADVQAGAWPFDGSFTDWVAPTGWDALPVPAGYRWDVDDLA